MSRSVARTGICRRALSALNLPPAACLAASGLAHATQSNEHDGLDPRISSITDGPACGHAQWGLFQQDSQTGEVMRPRYAPQSFVPGSVATLFGVSGARDTLGGDHRYVTPVHAVGQRRAPTREGDPNLLARGELIPGGRTADDGAVAFTEVDHTYARTRPAWRRISSRHRSAGAEAPPYTHPPLPGRAAGWTPDLSVTSGPGGGAWSPVPGPRGRGTPGCGTVPDPRRGRRFPGSCAA